MSTLELNGKDFATQTSSAEPVLASTVTGGAGLSGSTSLGIVTVGNLSHADIVYPAGHIIGSNMGLFEWTDDISATDTSEVFGPVVSLQLKKANANIYATYNLDGFKHDTVNVYLNVAYKATSFTAGEGNDSHGGAKLNQENDNYFRYFTTTQYQQYTIHVTNSHSLGNSAGDTYYFAPEGRSVAGTWLPHNAGPNSHCLLCIWEIA